MILRDAPPGLRVQVLAVILVAATAGVVLLWLGLTALLTLTRGISSGAEILAFAPLDLLPLPLSITFLAFAGLPFCAKSEDAAPRRKRARMSRRGIEPANVLFGIAVAGALLSIALLPISRFAVGQIVANRGYRSCPPSQNWERHAPLRWARPGGRCP